MLLLCLYMLCLGNTQLNKEVLDKLIAEAKNSHSTGLVIWKDGKQYGEWYFDREPYPIEALSARCLIFATEPDN
jgi:hypothetical protein